MWVCVCGGGACVGDGRTRGIWVRAPLWQASLPWAVAARSRKRTTGRLGVGDTRRSCATAACHDAAAARACLATVLPLPPLTTPVRPPLPPPPQIAVTRAAADHWRSIGEEVERRRAWAEYEALKAAAERSMPKSKRPRVPKPWQSLGSEVGSWGGEHGTRRAAVGNGAGVVGFGSFGVLGVHAGEIK